MTLVLKAGGHWEPHPKGTFAATCIDVVDLGEVQTQYDGVTRMQHKLRLVFWSGHWSEPRNVDGEMRPMALTVSRRFTASLHEAAALRAFLRVWRGADLTDAKLNGGWNVEELVGVGAFLQVGHHEYQGKTYAHIDAALRLPKGSNPPGIPTGYVRVKDRDNIEEGEIGPERVVVTDALGTTSVRTADGEETDDGLPF